MVRPFKLLDSAETPEGRLELRQRGERDFMISIAGRVLMSSHIHRSETAVAELACGALRGRKSPRVLIGGLGLGFTLRAALDALPSKAYVQVAELNPAVGRWCREHVGALTEHALSDARVTLVEGDVTQQIREVAQDPRRPRFDAIVLDLYLGPSDADPANGPLYGRKVLSDTAAALSDAGVYAVWSEEPSRKFEKRLEDAGFGVERVRTEGGGPRHAVYVATKGAERNGKAGGERTAKTPRTPRTRS